MVCDVSGCQRVTCKPTAINSMMACRSPRIKVRQNTVSVTVLTSFYARGLRPECPEAGLGKLKPGTYSVFYEDPDGARHPLGQIQIGPGDS